MNESRCPCCGSENIQEFKETISRKLNKDLEVSFEGVNNICLDCEEEGDFFNVNDQLFLLEKAKAEKDFLSHILEDIKERGITLAYIERVLSLPQRTLTRWKNQGASASGITLMTLIKTYPWLLKVADHKFDESYAKRELIQQAAITFSSSLNNAGFFFKDQQWIVESNQEATFKIAIECPATGTDNVDVFSVAPQSLKYGT